MALPKSTKRRYNVRSNSSCSSVETGYASDNSSESEIVDGNCSKTGKTDFKKPRVVKNEFTLPCKRVKTDHENTTRAGRQPTCFSRNAINARLNRIKKKKLMEELDNQLATLSDENSKLKEAEQKKDATIEKLKTEVHYLRSVLANSREIGMLLRCIKTSGLPVSSSLCKEPVNSIPPVKDSAYTVNENDSGFNSFDSDFDSKDPFLPCSETTLLPNELFEQNSHYESLQPFPDLDLPPVGGICLHVAQNNISVEFCAYCNANGPSTFEEETVKT